MKKKLLWSRKWFVLRNGFLLEYNSKDTTKRASNKIALYECQIEEYKSEKYEYSSFSIKDQTGEQFVLRADSYQDMLFWLNAILKEKFIIEETIDNIQ